MAQPRTGTVVAGAGAATPHSISLKVLRLSHPTLSPANPLPGDDLLAKASLPYPSAPVDPFPLSACLALPPAFGAAYVGTTFSCTLCANNELSPTSSIAVRDIRLSAELQIPSGSIALTLEGTGDDAEGQELQPAKTLQRVVRHELKEDGPHVLAITVDYTEAREDDTPVSRTFRKLYQFVAQPALGVRTKVGDLVPKGTPAKRRFVLEAQLENLTQTTLVLEKATIDAGSGLKSTSLNWKDGDEKPILSPQDVMQIAFKIEQIEGEVVEEKNGRVVLAQLHVQWRSPMGEKGRLTTGWLGSRGGR